MKASIKLRIKSLQVELDQINAERNTKAVPVQQALEKEFGDYFTQSIPVIQAIEALESSTDYAVDEDGFLMRWVRVDVKALSEGFTDELERYLSSEGFMLDVKNECIMINEGDFIGIDAEDGSVYLNESGHCTTIAERSEYSTVAERNALIEAWMESKGHYPSVVVVGRYGDVRPVNTIKASA